MKKLSIALVSLIALAISAHAQAPAAVGPGSVKLGKIAPEPVKTPEFQLSSGPTKRSKNLDWLEVEFEYATKPEVIDELTFKVTVMVGKNLLDGEVTYVSIGEGQHFGVVYLSPKVIKQLTGGKPIAGAVENIWVDVLRQGQTLDSAAVKPVKQPNLQRLGGMVLRKDQTPFAPLFYDRYEEVKSAR